MPEENKFEEVKEYFYLGNLIIQDSRSTKEVQHRVGIAKVSFWDNKELIWRNININLKMRMATLCQW